MKRLILPIMFMILLLSSCDPVDIIQCENNEILIDGACEPVEDEDDNPTPEVEFENYSGYVSTIEIEQIGTPSSIQFPGLSFTAYYEDVMYSAVSTSLCVTVYVSDSNYQGATYYLVGRYVGSTLEEERYIFTSGSRTTTYQACFNGVSLANEYEILIAKDDTDAPESHSTLLSMNTLVLHDPRMEQRGIVYQVPISDTTPEFQDYRTLASIELTPIFKDESHAIEEMTFELYEETTGTQIETATITIDATMYDGDELQLPTMVFNNLLPGTEYIVKGRMSGNDGIDAFTDISAVTYHRTTANYEHILIEMASHEVYALITGFEVLDGEIQVFYTLHNESDQAIDFVAEIGWMGEHFQVITDTIILEDMEGSFTYPTDNIVSGGSILLKEAGNNREHFSRLVNMSGKNYYNLFYPAVEDTKIQLEIPDDPYHDTLSCVLTIFDQDMTLLESIDINSYDVGYHILEVTTNKLDYDAIYGVITYQVETLFGVATYEYETQIPK